MLPSIPLLRARLHAVITDKGEQGHVINDLELTLDGLPDSYDALAAFGERLADLPLRENWPYDEPSDLDSIWAACDPARPTIPIAVLSPTDARARVEAAWQARVCGCILGKPFEFDPTLEELRAALEPHGEWPLRDYVTETAVASLRHRIPQWTETVRERITHVAPDDDLNYTILGMLLLEEHGAQFTKEHLRDLWLLQLPVRATFGPERTMMVKAAAEALEDEMPAPDMEHWARVLNPRDEYCGALIRADAYGYACLGHPALAAELAWRDSSFTHRRTGIYSTMFVAAAIAAAPVVSTPLEMFQVALGFVPRRSRFAAIVADSLTEVAAARDWLDGYARIHGRYGAYSHCRVFQEIGTLANTLRFADDVGDGICLQVMQGNDTDSFGATAGSLLGAYLGPGHLEARWLAPFNDDIHPALALFYERSLARLTERMGALPDHVRTTERA